MRYHEQGALTLPPAILQMAGQPGDSLYIQMVRGFVKQEHIPTADKQPRQVHTPALAARQLVHMRMPLNVGQQRTKDFADTGIGSPFVFGDIAHHGTLDRIVVPQMVTLSQVADRQIAPLLHTP